MKIGPLVPFDGYGCAFGRLAFVQLALVFGWLLVFKASVAMAADAEDDATTGKRVIEFSGLSWEVKHSGLKRVGPGPNQFSDRNVSVDGKGRLHLKITREKGEDGRTRWYCAEVICKTNFGGYGTYRWYIDSPIQADPNVVLGLFTWDNTSSEEHHREIDIELISTWGEADSERNAQYVVQPWDEVGRRKRWQIPVTNGPAISTHAFIWRTGTVEFLSLSGHNKAPSEDAAKLRSWTFRGPGIPTPSSEQVRMNLWLLKRLADDAPEPEVIISRFDFEPVSRLQKCQ